MTHPLPDVIISLNVVLSIWRSSVQHHGPISILVLNSLINAEGDISICLICLFVWGFSSHSRVSHSYGDFTIANEGLQILIYARHSWPLSSEGSLACHTYSDTGRPFIWSSSRARDTHTYCRAFDSGAVTAYLYDLGLSRLGFEHPTFRLRGERFSALRYRRGHFNMNCSYAWISKNDAQMLDLGWSDHRPRSKDIYAYVSKKRC